MLLQAARAINIVIFMPFPIRSDLNTPGHIHSGYAEEYQRKDYRLQWPDGIPGKIEWWYVYMEWPRS